MHPIRIAYFWQIQDPGNAGTVIRTADAFGCNAVMFSSGSVDVFSPKVVRSTVGSLWHIPIFEDVEPREILEISGAKIFVTDGAGELELAAAVKEQGSVAIWVFGNEARGISDLPAELLSRAQSVAIPMSGGAESLNIASAASIVLYSASLST
jgi:TrmH family RNA methyltransferase